MMPALVTQLFDYVRERHPRTLRGVEEAREIAPERFDEMTEMFLGWLARARGAEAIPATVDSFVRFTTAVNLAQARYDADGHYENRSFAELYANHYSQNETMTDYLWGVYLTNFLWAHHVEISLFYRDSFLARMAPDAQLVEIAPGHGGWGAWALSVLQQARLKGYDISPSSIQIARTMIRAAGLEGRAEYEERNALELPDSLANTADGVVCCFLAEHLERPGELLAGIQKVLKPRSIAFVTSVLTAAQVDHIYEFRYESEIVKLCEENGLRALATLSAGPKRMLPRGRFLPRSMALILQKRTQETF